MDLKVKIYVTLGVLSPVFLYMGGRLSILVVIWTSVVLFLPELLKPKEVEKEQKVEPKKKDHVCKCGGKNGKSEAAHSDEGKEECCGGKGTGVNGKECCGKGGKKKVEVEPKKPKDGCCSSGGKKSGKKCCGGKGHGHGKETKDTKEPSPATAQEWDSLTVDFTNAFKPAKTSKAKKTVKVFGKKGMTQISSKQEDSNSGDLIKSAFTVSNDELLNSDIYVFYSSLQGSAEKAAGIVQEKLKAVEGLKNEPKLLNLDEIDDTDKYFVDVPSENALYVLVVPSYDVDCPLDYFIQTLEENFNDHRLDRFPLRKLVGYTVLGLGDSESWPDKFCYQANKVDYWVSHLGGRRIFPVGKICMKYDGFEKVGEWAELLGELLKDNEPILYEYDENVDDSEEDGDDQDGSDEGGEGSDQEVDLEDVGGKESDSKRNENSLEVKQMIAKDSPTYRNLTKQGYRIVGSHSGVKICRWTKNELRGKGSCYKKSLFNIASSRCMELTPSLACSSKCVFCWRHGTNPVSKNWRWETDEPEFILENALAAHYSMIKQMRGVPGVIADRFINAFKVAHCALSLVGEPILYPYISKFVELLHEKDISSFLVCNAQHPESLRSLGKVTQLYVSIDASTKDELRKVDRPLYKDFWERMMECLDIIRTTQSHQRTVFRLTLVKGFNMGDISAYADLVQRGVPCFIEVKGATFSGSSKDNVNALTMQNIPFNEECKDFVENFVAELKRRGLPYDIAAEHAHSNCVLIADTKFKVDGKWNTHIDFAKFFELLRSGESFTHMDYMQETPEWALYGNGGFAPGNVRVAHGDRVANDGRVDAADLPEIPVGAV
ncbi:putative tRNA 4-demethylwyosine synthase [Maudiozyma humilis]|uniref:S-adenosyl-L-methionine-dependent tRNA 4-demethylwyosine synthase n=1 Tax=Maudiozyma humilis TaxID=51915 RepID=A0AAV5RWS1_MAUHU|nr:putative tRNA 4-demethylwyosine synthase [Kazachstania humilis]